MKKITLIFLLPLLFLFSKPAMACDMAGVSSCMDFSLDRAPETPLYDEGQGGLTDDKFSFTDSPIRFSIHGKARITTGVTSIKIK